MKLIKNKKGFTIVETLIVLAVTGVFFVTTASLINGQVERNRYQDSMRQLQALFQTTINDVEDGYMKSNLGTDDQKVLAGKRFWFCGDSAPFGFCPGTSSNLMYIETVVFDGASNTFKYEDQTTVALPSNLKFLYYKNLINSNGDIGGTRSKEFGSSILLTDTNGMTGKNISTLTSARLYSRSGVTQPNLLSSHSTHGFILCFEGLRKGSIELGALNNGSTITMKPDDERCS